VSNSIYTIQLIVIIISHVSYRDKPHEEKKYLVFESNLLSLFTNCPQCDLLTEPTTYTIGTVYCKNALCAITSDSGQFPVVIPWLHYTTTTIATKSRQRIKKEKIGTPYYSRNTRRVVILLGK
jgi:hypothetical protein